MYRSVHYLDSDRTKKIYIVFVCDMEQLSNLQFIERLLCVGVFKLVGIEEFHRWPRHPPGLIPNVNIIRTLFIRLHGVITTITCIIDPEHHETQTNTNNNKIKKHRKRTLPSCVHTKKIHHALSLSFRRVLVLQVVQRPAANARGVQRRQADGRERDALFRIGSQMFHAGAETRSPSHCRGRGKKKFFLKLKFYVCRSRCALADL